MKHALLASLFPLLAAAAVYPVYAQGTDASKQALVQRVLVLWHIEDSAIAMAQRPATEAMLQARAVLQGRVSPQKQEATLKDIVVDVQKYINEATPLVRAEALRLKNSTLGPLLMQNFNEDELRNLIALFESPVKKKFEALAPQFERALGEKVADSSRSVIDPKIQALSQSIGAKMRAVMLVAP